MIKIVLIFSVLCLSVSAQSERLIKAIFVDASKDSPKSATLYIAKSTNNARNSLLPRGESIETDLLRTRLSRGVKIPSGKVVAWILDKAPSKEEGIPTGAQKISFPAEWKRIGLIFTKDPENNVFPAKVIPINLSSEDFKPGTIMLYNFSKSEMDAKLGETALTLASNSYKIISEPKTEKGSYIAKIDCILPDNQGRFPVVRSRWVSYKKSRSIKFMVDSSIAKSPRFFGVRDRD